MLTKLSPASIMNSKFLGYWIDSDVWHPQKSQNSEALAGILTDSFVANYPIGMLLISIAEQAAAF